MVRAADYNCAYVSKMAVLLIFPVVLQTVISLVMLSIGGQGEHCKLVQWAQDGAPTKN